MGNIQEGMEDRQRAIKLYSTNLCEPCKTLKAWFEQEGIAYQEIQMATLDSVESEAVERAILAVSSIEKATIPAVCMVINGQEHWISNHGQADITEMTKEIETLLSSSAAGPFGARGG